MMNLAKFEPLNSFEPIRVLDTHPDGIHVALQVFTEDAEESAVWNRHTKRIVWQPRYAHALAWLQQGKQVACLQDPNEPEDFIFSLYSWPDTQIIAQYPFKLAMGRIIDVVISPQSNFAVCKWIEQAEVGFDFFDITNLGISRPFFSSFMYQGTNTGSHAVFSPDGSYWTFYCFDVRAVRGVYDGQSIENPNGGSYQVGTLFIFQKEHALKEIPLIAVMEKGQSVEDFFENDDIILDPIFLDTQRIEICLPTGERQIHVI